MLRNTLAGSKKVVSMSRNTTVGARTPPLYLRTEEMKEEEISTVEKEEVEG